MKSLLPFLTYALVTSFTPGPNNIMSLVNAKQFGLKRTFRFILGVTLGFLVVMLLASYFNLILFRLLPSIKGFMNGIGAVYMLYLAYLMVKPGAHGASVNATNTLWSGFILQFINVKVILYGITVVATFIIPYSKSALHLGLSSVFLALVGFLATTCWALGGSLFQNFLTRHHLSFHWTMAGLLIFSAVSVFIH